jgi:hypothetical protein
MGEYCCIRIWQLKHGASSTELEALIGAEMTMMQNLLPGVKRCILFRIHPTTGETIQYMLIIAFAHAEAYTYWRQVEEEAPTYWPNFASLLFRLEQTCTLLNEYIATIVLEKFIG